MTSLLGISGSLRKASTNTKLMRHAAMHFAADTFVEGDLRLPLYDGDLETAEGIPTAVQTLSDQIKAADAVIIATPEYNKSLPGVLKNALDWVSRTYGAPWRNKPVAIMSAAAGRAGGERSQFSLRLAMAPFRPVLLQGPEVLVAASGTQFDESGTLTNDINDKALKELMVDLRALI
ncbi:MAG: NAD(P)H-dependent oxidoreductase [Pseudomonadota bacterium]